MPQTLLTPQTITHELLKRFKNNLGFASSIRHEYDDRFASTPGKIGDTLQLRVPVRFVASDGATLVIQDVEEKSVSLVINKQKHVGFQFGSKDRTLTIERFGDRYLDSAAVALANIVDVDGLTEAYQGVAQTVGTPGTIPNTLKTYNQAMATLDKAGLNLDDKRFFCISPDMQVEIVDALKGLFQSAEKISSQYAKGRMGIAAGGTWIMDQNVRTHTVGALGGTPAVGAAGQTGSTLATTGWSLSAAPRLKKGDTFTIAGVFAVNPVSGDVLPDLKRFTVTADVSSTAGGTADLPISPPIITTGPTKNVSAGPAGGALITVLGAAGAASATGLAYHRDFMAFAMVPMDLPGGTDTAARSTDRETGMSIRTVSDYDITNDRFITRCDILYGWKVCIPEFACRIAS